MTSTGISLPAETIPWGVIRSISVGHQGDVVAQQRFVDRILGIDHDRARRHRRRWRDHFCDELGPAGQLLLDIGDARIAAHLVRRAGGMGILEVGIGFGRCLDIAGAVEPAQPEPREVDVVGKIPFQPQALLGQLGDVHRVFEAPARRALEQVDVAGDLRQFRRGLIARSARADHGDALVCERDIVAPLRGVAALSGEALHAFDIGHLRAREEADAADQGIEPVSPGAFGRLHLDHPDLIHLVPDHRCDFGFERNRIAQAELVGDPAHVFHVLVARAEVVGIGEVDPEQVRVAAARRIDPRAGVAVLVPGAADFGVLLEHHIGNARTLEVHCGVEAGKARADDADQELLPLFRRRRLAPAEAANEWIERGGFQPHVPFLFGNVLAGGQRQAVLQALPGAEIGDCRTRLAVGLEPGEGLVPEQRHIAFARHHADTARRAIGTAFAHRRGFGREYRLVAGQLIEQPAQYHRIGIAQGILDRFVAGRLQFLSRGHSSCAPLLFRRGA